MIVKGASRSGPQQLAVYLMRVERYDTGEPTHLLDLQSIRALGVDANNRERTAAQLIEVFRDWQSSVEGTKQGRDGLYHCEISPEAKYARDMTKKEWLRLADIAGDELGLGGQPRAVVLHAGKDGRPHLHVVWQRTDIEKMKVVSDAYNYIAHERASLRMEKELGHEIVPGKHAKRDRKRQKDFPRAKLTQAEDQYQKRTGLSKDQRVAQIATLKAISENGPAFKAALEQAGYVLAKGDRHAAKGDAGYFVVVDQKGGQSGLTRNVGLNEKELQAFMKGVDLNKLPTVQEAKALQAERRKAMRGAKEEAADQASKKRPRDDLKELKETLTALKASADGPQSFKAAIEEAGFVLANGDRGYTLVDENGDFYNLARQLKVKLAEVNGYLAPVPLTSLPTVEQAQALQAERREAVSKSDGTPEPTPKAKEQGIEASKFLEAEVWQKQPEPIQTPEKAVSEPVRKQRENRKPVPMDPKRQQQITALREWSDGAKAFKLALEKAGYTLARGETGYVLFSKDGVFNLARHAGLDIYTLDAYMSPVPLDSLPEVKDLIKGNKQAPAESKFIGAQSEAPQPMRVRTEDIDLDTRMDISALDMAAEAIAEAQRKARQQEDRDLQALEEAIRKDHEEAVAKLSERHERDLRDAEAALDREIVVKLANYKNIQAEQTESFLNARKESRTGIRGFIDAVENRWNPTLAAEKAKERERERQNFYRRLAKERADYEILLQQTKQLEIENLIERQRFQQDALKTKAADEHERYIREYHEAKRIKAEIEAQHEEEELERDNSLRDGPPPPELGKS